MDEWILTVALDAAAVTPASSERRGDPAMKVACVIAIICGDSVLVRKRDRAVIGMGVSLLECPGGKVEQGETATDTIVRETFEETGIELELADPVFQEAKWQKNGWYVLRYTWRVSETLLGTRWKHPKTVGWRFAPIDQVLKDGCMEELELALLNLDRGEPA